MIRLDRVSALNLVVLLNYLQRHPPEADPDTMWRDNLAHAETLNPNDDDELSPEQHPLVRVIFEQANGLGTPSTRQLIDTPLNQLINQLIGDDSAESTIVEKVARLVSEPYAENRLTGRLLEDLRRTLMTKEEQAQLISKLDEASLICSGCQARFENSEMLSIKLTPDGLMTLRCARCNMPNWQRCGAIGCAEVVRMKIPASRCSAHDESNSTDSWVQAFVTPDLNTDLNTETTSAPTLSRTLRRASTLFTPHPTRRRNR